MAEQERFAPPFPDRSRGYADVKDLNSHPKNQELYEDRDNNELVERIDENGFRDSQRLLVCSDGTILSGHRRYVAAVKLGMDRVPIEARGIDPDSDEAVLELLTANDYRDKTPAEKIREGELWEEIEREEAKERKTSTLKEGNEDPDTENLPERDKGETREKVGEKIGVSGRTYEKGKTVKEKADQGDDTAQEQWEQLETGEQSIHGAYSKVKEAEREEETEPETEMPELPDETYRAIVIDPPWPIEKIGRDERPDQGKYLDYPTMDLDDIRELPVPELASDSGAHIYLWTTQKYLPEAFAMVEAWGGRFECLLTWVKPTGVAPFSWQYNTEHVLFARYGDGLEMDELGQQISFEAPVTKHSEKPEVFYERVVNASPGPRLEMFAREPRDGFEVWGDEVTEGD